MPFSIFLQVYAALIANGYTRRVDRWVDGKVVEVREREENCFAYHSSKSGWIPINPAFFQDLMFAERYTIEMRVKTLATGLDLYGHHTFPIKLRLNRDLPLNFVGKYARFQHVFREDVDERTGTKTNKSYLYLHYERPQPNDHSPENLYRIFWKTPNQEFDGPGLRLEYAQNFFARNRMRPY